MAEDGILVNFAINEDAFRALPKIKGGSWKDRFVAKKISRYHRNKRPALPLSGPNAASLQPRKSKSDEKPLDDDGFAESRVAKRRKQEGSFSRGSSEFVPSTKISDAKPSGTVQRLLGDREVISSLFTYNPKPSAVSKVDQREDTQSAKPSNAPLIDGLDTFTSLGLSETLAAYLLTKLELKGPTAIQKAAISQLLKEDADAFIQSETGSGKTLAYLLPLVQRIMSLKSATIQQKENISRDSGLFAIILAPTRELCKQISVVLERLLGCAHWIVAGTVIGGEKKKSEKARLRKGLNVLVATPGRLADHLENTKVLDISNVRWLVLDEGDRLVDLGFEEEIQKIVTKLDERQRPNAMMTGLPQRRTTILCSATMKMNVQKLGEISLKDANLIRGEGSSEDSKVSKDAFLAPAQLKQSYSVVAAKLRLVTLIALLKRTFARKGSVMKAIVFASCADSVDFLFTILSQDEKFPEKDTESAEITKDSKPADTNQASTSVSSSPMLSSSANALTIFKLHGSLPQPTRTSIVTTFSKSTTPSLLISTDVASRGLDLPNLDLVIEYDPAFSSDDHLHRIGRTARLGRDGRAMIFLLPGEEESYVDVLKQSYRDTEGARGLTNVSAEEILKRGFAPQILRPSTATSQASAQASSWETSATTTQLEIERLVLSDPITLQPLARRAFQSHIRAYATHTSAERKYFDIKSLHLGHLAKSFGLRDKPSGIGIPGRNDGKTAHNSRGSNKKRARPMEGHNGDADGRFKTDDDSMEAERRKKMRSKMMMVGAGADEFNIA